MSPVWWVEYSGKRMLVEAPDVEAADDAAILRFGRIPDAVYPADEDPAMPSSADPSPSAADSASDQAGSTGTGNQQDGDQS